MRSITKILILAVVLATVSCQQKSENPSAGEFVDISITAGIPGAIGTYADGTSPSSGAFSHQGGALNVDHERLDLRYIIEVWTDEQTPRLAFRDVQTVDRDFDKTPVSFSMRLQSLSYHFVLWADFVTEDTNEDLHYRTDANLQNITYAEDIAGPGDMASEEMDAFCAVEKVDFITEGMTKNITLRRPFGKIRLIATDNVDSDGFVDIHPVTATIDFKDSRFPDTYNALTQKATVSNNGTEAPSSNAFDFTVVPEDALISDSTYTGSYLLGFNYFFANDQAPSHEMDVTVYGNAEKTVTLNTVSLSSIPLSTNKLTTVVGNFYSSEGTISIIVDDSFDSPENISDPEK